MKLINFEVLQREREVGAATLLFFMANFFFTRLDNKGLDSRYSYTCSPFFPPLTFPLVGSFFCVSGKEAEGGGKGGGGRRRRRRGNKRVGGGGGGGGENPTGNYEKLLAQHDRNFIFDHN